MKIEVFYDYICNQNKLSDSSLKDIEEILNEYPYFQTARSLCLKNLYNISDIKFEKSLKYNAVFIPDRKVLFHLIHEDKRKETISNNENNNTIQNIQFNISDLIENEKGECIENAFNNENTETQQTDNQTITTSKEEIENEKIEEKTESIADKILRQINEVKENGESIENAFSNENAETQQTDNQTVATSKEEIESEKIEEKTESIADKILRQINEVKENGESIENAFSNENTETQSTDNQTVATSKKEIESEKIEEKTESIADKILRQINEAKEKGESIENAFNNENAEIQQTDNQTVATSKEEIESEKIEEKTESIADKILRQINEAKEKGESIENAFSNENTETQSTDNQTITTSKEEIESEKIEEKTESIADKILRQINEAKEKGESIENAFNNENTETQSTNNQTVATSEKEIESEKIEEKTESIADKILRQINEAKEKGESIENAFSNENTEKKEEKETNEELIDKFIKEEPRIIADKNYIPKNKAKEEFSANIFTEKLAEIYVKQKHFDRAIEIYQKLNLKNSEKSVYFAEKIKKIEELKNNN